MLIAIPDHNANTKPRTYEQANRDKLEAEVEQFFVEDPGGTKQLFLDAIEKLKAMQGSDWFMVRNYDQPPPVLATLFSAVCTLMLVRDSWKSARNLVGSSVQNMEVSVFIAVTSVVLRCVATRCDGSRRGVSGRVRFDSVCTGSTVRITHMCLCLRKRPRVAKREDAGIGACGWTLLSGLRVATRMQHAFGTVKGSILISSRHLWPLLSPDDGTRMTLADEDGSLPSHFS